MHGPSQVVDGLSVEYVPGRKSMYVSELEILYVIPRPKQITWTFGNTRFIKTSRYIAEDQEEGCHRLKIIFSIAVLEQHAYRCAVAGHGISKSAEICGCVLSHRAAYFLLND